jgi:hypothetical protein
VFARWLAVSCIPLVLQQFVPVVEQELVPVVKANPG